MEALVDETLGRPVELTPPGPATQRIIARAERPTSLSSLSCPPKLGKRKGRGRQVANIKK